MNVSEMKCAVYNDKCDHEDTGENDDCYRQCMIGCLCSWHSWDVPHEDYGWTCCGLVMWCEYRLLPECSVTHSVSGCPRKG